MQERIPNKVSVVIPFYNNGNYLAEAIESVLNQTLKPDEVIVIDDGSSDNSVKVAESFLPHLKLIKSKHGGAASARNAGVLKSRGNYLAFLDADDLWLPYKLEIQLEFLASNNNVDILFGKATQFYSPDLAANKRKKIQKVAGAQPFHGPQTLMLSKKVFLSVGLFNEEYKTAENIDWYMRALNSGHKIHTLTNVLVRRRIHSNNTSRLKKSYRNESLKIARDTLVRRRKKTSNS